MTEETKESTNEKVKENIKENITNKPIDLCKLSNSELVTHSKVAAQNERNATTWVLNILLEVQKRRLHLEYGYGSVFEYAVKEMGYDEAAASRRVQAMRLMADIPEVEEKISMGKISLTNAAAAQRFFSAEKRLNDETPTLGRKLDVVQKIEGKSVREAEMELAKLNPRILPKERERLLTEDTLELRIVVTRELKNKLEKLKGLLAHKKPSLNYQELIEELAEISLDKLDRTRHTSAAAPLSHEVENCQPAKNQYSRYISEKVKARVWKRDGGCCAFVSPVTKNRCSSKYKLEFDHIVPFAKGGTNEEDNLRLACSAHNKYLAQQ